MTRGPVNIGDEIADTHAQQANEIFAKLTDKQLEVMALVAEHRTSKEIAWFLGVSESAVNQRIESVRARFNSAPRAELARRYRRYRQGSWSTA